MLRIRISLYVFDCCPHIHNIIDIWIVWRNRIQIRIENPTTCNNPKDKCNWKRYNQEFSEASDKRSRRENLVLRQFEEISPFRQVFQVGQLFLFSRSSSLESHAVRHYFFNSFSLLYISSFRARPLRKSTKKIALPVFKLVLKVECKWATELSGRYYFFSTCFVKCTPN